MPIRDAYDVIVVGGGSAGTSAAAAASAAGAATLMINDGELGGLCILRGCMPTKSLLEAAHAAHSAAHTSAFGVEVDAAPVMEFERVMRRKDLHVERFKQAKIRGIEGAAYDLLDGRARFVDGPAVEAAGRRLTAAGYVIATGSSPEIPAIPGIDTIPLLTSDDALRLTERPGRMIVHGGGAIGLELALFFARAGTEITLVARSPLLHRYDREAGDELRKVLDDEPRFRVLAPAALESLAPCGAGLSAVVRHADSVETIEADVLLSAVGRRADLDDLGLCHVGIEPADGTLEHDSTMRTWCDRVWVAGDATGRHQILHLANEEGRIAGANAAAAALGRRATARTAVADPRHIDYRLSMQVIFTDPPFAQVGLTADQARQQGRQVVVGAARFAETGRAITMETRHGLWKLIADRASGEVLGSTILGPRADDLAHLVMLLMHRRATAAEILELPWYHPTLSEVMLDIARDVERRRS